MKNWKTMLLGLLAGLTGSSAVGWTKTDGSLNYLAIAFAVVTAALGYFTKDKDVTGGTVAQTKVAAAATGDSPVGLPGPAAVTPSVEPKE